MGALGLTLLRDLLGFQVPAQVLGALPAPGQWRPLSRETKVLSQVLHAGGITGAMGLAVHLAFPSRAYLRERYPSKARWPWPALYGYRWMDQLRQVVVGLAARFRYK